MQEIVVGLPLRLSGAEGTQSEKMRRFASDLESHFGVTVHLWDERWTSSEANRVLRSEFPELVSTLTVQLPDEHSRRVGQSIAAASLPVI